MQSLVLSSEAELLCSDQTESLDFESGFIIQLNMTQNIVYYILRHSDD